MRQALAALIRLGAQSPLQVLAVVVSDNRVFESELQMLLQCGIPTVVLSDMAVRPCMCAGGV